jgi:hypothetical protein
MARQRLDEFLKPGGHGPDDDHEGARWLNSLVPYLQARYPEPERWGTEQVLAGGPGDPGLGYVLAIVGSDGHVAEVLCEYEIDRPPYRLDPAAVRRPLRTIIDGVSGIRFAPPEAA